MWKARIVPAVGKLKSIHTTVLRRVFPNSARLGFPWVHLPDGSVTFRERGFVSASSPAMLLARHNYETGYIRRLLAGVTATKSLEIGCGYGRLTPTFASFSYDHVAIDINTAALRLARTAYPQFSFQYSSVADLPFADGCFDLVTTWTVLQHVPPDRISRACAEIVRVLAPGGTLLICEETRHAGVPAIATHTWHRHMDDYARMLDPLSLDYSSAILEIETLSHADAPGTVAVWRSPRTPRS